MTGMRQIAAIPAERVAKGQFGGGGVGGEGLATPTLRLRGGRAGSMAQTALDGALEDAASAAISSALGA